MMPGKRKRSDGVATAVQGITTATTNGKPLSAVAAARLKAEAAKEGLKLDITPVPIVSESFPEPEASRPLPQSPLLAPTESESDEEPVLIKQNLRLCSWRNEAQNIVSDTDWELTVKLNKHTTIALIGCFHFKVLRGAVNVNGANIDTLSRRGQKDQRYTVYSPATHLISKIRGLDSANQVQFSNCEVPTPATGSDPLFSDIWAAQAEKGQNRSFSVIIESSADELARPLVPEATPEDWLRAIEECVMSPSIIFIVGASTCGKSTFARRLLNRYLTGQGKSARPTSSVCYLDLDPLKPEYAPHGQISLTVIRSLDLGPAFTHPVTSPSSQGPETDETIRSHAVPPNLANYGDYYRACAEDLFLTYKHLRSRDPLLPLIINTSGSLNSAYTSMLMELLARFKPHHVVHLGDTQAIDTEQAAKLDACQIIVSQSHGTLHEITAQAPVIAPMRSDTELRAMQMQSYFHLRKISTSEASPSSWTPNPLSALAPWEFCFEETEGRMQDFVGFAMYSEPVESASLVQALNGSIVHIVESTSSAIPSPYTVLPRTKKYRVPFFDKSVRTGMVEPLDPRTSKVVCTALIRAFDPEKRVVQILVPKTHESLLRNLQPERTVLVGGCCDSPEWAYMEDANSRASARGNSLLVQDETVHAPWVENTGRMESMGYLNTVRRVRKFQT